MSITVKTGQFKPVGNCVIISNGDVEAIVSVDVGPRIISLRAFGGDNFFYVDENLEFYTEHPSLPEAYGKDRYYFYGGHRMCITPECFPDTYYPDDEPVEWTQTEKGAIFTPPTRPSGLAYSIELRLADCGAELEVIHSVKNDSGENKEFALWGISQMDKGGIGVTPQNDRQCAPLPNRVFVHWPYNDMRDDRFNASMKYITLRQDIYGDGSFKYGTNCEKGWGGYIYKGQMFVKYFAPAVEDSLNPLPYADLGCNFESYTDRRALEVESLSAVFKVAPGESRSMVERWVVRQLPGEVPPVRSAEFDEYIDSLGI